MPRSSCRHNFVGTIHTFKQTRTKTATTKLPVSKRARMAFISAAIQGDIFGTATQKLSSMQTVRRLIYAEIIQPGRQNLTLRKQTKNDKMNYFRQIVPWLCLLTAPVDAVDNKSCALERIDRNSKKGIEL